MTCGPGDRDGVCGADDSVAVPSRVEASARGLRVTYAHPQLPDSAFEMGWEQVDGVSVYALEGSAGQGLFMSFEHENGEFTEIHSCMVGWDQVMTSLGDFLPLQVESVAEVLSWLGVDDPPVTLLARRVG